MGQVRETFSEVSNKGVISPIYQSRRVSLCTRVRVPVYNYFSTHSNLRARNRSVRLSERQEEKVYL